MQRKQYLRSYVLFCIKLGLGMFVICQRDESAPKKDTNQNNCSEMRNVCKLGIFFELHDFKRIALFPLIIITLDLNFAHSSDQIIWKIK